MSQASPVLYLPDTNIFVHYARKSAVAQFVEQRYRLQGDLTKPLVSIVTHGEMRAFALQNRWGETKIRLVTDFLAVCKTVLVDSEEILNAYALLDTYSRSVGRAMGDNDLWIAAAAFVNGATLLTTDKDFDHLHPVYIQREWVNPSII